MTAIDFVKKIEGASVNTLAVPIVDSNGDNVSVVFDAEECLFVVYKSRIDGKDYELVPSDKCSRCAFHDKKVHMCANPESNLPCKFGFIYKEIKE